MEHDDPDGGTRLKDLKGNIVPRHIKSKGKLIKNPNAKRIESDMKRQHAAAFKVRLRCCVLQCSR